MAIRRPGPRLLRGVPFAFVRARDGGRKAVDASIAMVPFIDCLVVLVVFLLTFFTASGQLCGGSRALAMPDAVHAVDLEIAPIISVSPRSVRLDGRRMADVATLREMAEPEIIDALVADLGTLARNWEILHPGDPFPSTVIVQADRGTDYRVLRHVLHSVATAGYANVSFAVYRREK
jgi:biopolymer transport protein ExbD